MTRTTRIMIADDHELIREGLKRILAFENELEIIAEAQNGIEAIESLKTSTPDVVLLDVKMPMLNGIEVLKSIKQNYNEVKVIMLTVENDSRTIREAINIGADGYILKDSAGTEIINAIKTVVEGEKYIDKSLVSFLFTDIKNAYTKRNSVFDELSKREAEVLLFISKGLSNKEIAEKLFLSEKTVKNYTTAIFRKIDAKDRVHATILSIENELEEHLKNM